MFQDNVRSFAEPGSGGGCSRSWAWLRMTTATFCAVAMPLGQSGSVVLMANICDVAEMLRTRESARVSVCVLQIPLHCMAIHMSVKCGPVAALPLSLAAGRSILGC